MYVRCLLFYLLITGVLFSCDLLGFVCWVAALLCCRWVICCCVASLLFVLLELTCCLRGWGFGVARFLVGCFSLVWLCVFGTLGCSAFRVYGFWV